MKKDERIKIGVCGVDSGQILICDPYYIKHIIKLGDLEKIKPLFKGHLRFKQLKIRGGKKGDFKRKGLGVISSSGYGDGLYEVYVTLGPVKVGGGVRVKKLEVVFIREKVIL